MSLKDIKDREKIDPTRKTGDNMDGEKNALKKLNIEVSELDKSRIKQLLLLKEEAENKGDTDKIKEIDAELFKMRS